MFIAITGDPVLDFVIIQALSLHYLSNAALRLIKWKDTEYRYIRKMPIPPVISWYDKASFSYIRETREAGRPCIKTTGYSIQTMSRLSNILSNYNTSSLLSNPSLYLELKSSAALQLMFCIEYMEKNKCDFGEKSAVLEGGSYFIPDGLEKKDFPDFIPVLKEIYLNLTNDLDPGIVNTMELADILRGVSAWLNRIHFDYRNDFLTSLALEVLNRKSRNGLFCFNTADYALLPPGRQFFVMDALLQAFPFIQLDYILEEIFSVYLKLHRMLYNENNGIYVFKPRIISYNAFDVGALLSFLNRASHYSFNKFEQTNTINKILDVYLELLLGSYHRAHDNEIKKLIRWVKLSRTIQSNIKKQPGFNTVFPKRIYITTSNQDFNWNRKGIIDQTGVFFLCSALLSLINNRSDRFKLKKSAPL